MKTFVSFLGLLFLISPLFAQTNDCGTPTYCACQTGKSAFVIVPKSITSTLQDGDVIIARHGDMCVGQNTYIEGRAMNVTIWGTNDMTGDTGIPEGGEIEYSIYHPEAGYMTDALQAEYSLGDGRYAPGTWMHLSMLLLSDTALPVELTDFTAKFRSETSVELVWETASENNNAGYEVQHQIWDFPDVDPGPFAAYQTLDFVEGAGTTTRSQNYTYLVEGLVSGLHRFRLLQRDLDGSFSYSATVEVNVGVPQGFALTPPYPNPFNPSTNFTLRAAEPQDVEVAVYDVQGRRVRMLYQGNVRAGEEKQIRFEADGLASGMYLIRAQGASFVQSQIATLIR